MTTSRTRIIIVVVIGLVALAAVVFFLRRNGGEEQGEQGGPTTVVLARAGGQNIDRTIEAVANVEAAESVVITAEAVGRISQVAFTDGQRVARGQPLFRMESDQEAADVAVSRAEADELRQRLGRLQRLVEEGAIPRGEVEDVRRQLQAADARTASLRTLLNDTVVRAPFAGVVGLREASPGAFVQPGDELVSLDDTRSVKLSFTLPEQQLARVRVGSPVEARNPAFGDRVFRGEITGFDSRLGAGQRTLEIQARLANPDGLWRAGMLADIRVTAETVAEAVTVPPLAVQVRGDVQFVYRAVEGCAQRVEVEIGQREADWLEIVSGLRPGDAVVVEGYQELATGQPIVEARRNAARSPAGGVGGGGGDRVEKSGADARREQDKNRAAEERCQTLTQRLAEQPSGPAGPAR